MRGNIRGNYLVINGIVHSEKAFMQLPVENVIYEVIRLIDSRLIFLDDHLNRLHNSCKARNINLPDPNEILRDIQLLITRSEIQEGNIKYMAYELHSESHRSCFFIPHKYPAAYEYKKGVKLMTYPFERPDPNVKKWNDQFRKNVNDFIFNNSIYEALLINKEGFITEGSRSNVFFIDKEGVLITSPTQMVLPGITRSYVMKICTQLGYPIVEKMIHVNDLNQIKGCFLTGTSPKVLPVHSIDSVAYSPSHEMIGIIMEAFDIVLKDNIKKSGM